MKKILIYLITIIMLCSIAFATSNQYDNVNYNEYNLTNATAVRSNFFCNATNCYNIADFLTGGGSGDITAVVTDGIYLFPGGTSGDVTINLNETKLNNTIDLRSVSGGGQGKEGDNIYLYNDSSTMYLNETKLNITTNRSIISKVTQSFIESLNFVISSTIRSWINSNYTELNNSITTLDSKVGTLGNWSNDKSDYYNNSQVDTIINNQNNLSLQEVSENLGNWSGDKELYYNKTDIDNLNLTNISLELTSSTYTGNLAGFVGANTVCSSELSGYHLCTQVEIIEYIAKNDISSLASQDVWSSTGGPKYIPATVPVNDCNGWTYNGTSSYLGNYWHFNETGGEGRAINCGTSLYLACCK